MELVKKTPRKRTGKYAHVIDKLPRTFNLEGNYQERVTQTITVFYKTAIEAGHTLDATTLAEIYVEARKERDSIDDELKEANLKLEAVEQMLANEYEHIGITTLKLAGGESVRTQLEPHAVVKDKEVFRQWCVKNGYENMMSLPWPTTNSIVKERLLEGEKEPDGVEAIALPKVIFKKGDS